MSEITCHSCIGACCSDVKMVLSHQEAKRLRSAGTNLVTLLYPRAPVEVYKWTVEDLLPVNWSEPEGIAYIMKRAEDAREPWQKKFWLTLANTAQRMELDQGVFLMEGRCGFLQNDNSCGDYENRPDVCRAFSVGGAACKKFREDAGVDVRVTIRSATGHFDYVS